MTCITIDAGSATPAGSIGPFNLVYLNQSHAPQAAAFHNHIVSLLTQHEKSYVIEKDEAYFVSHFAKGAGNAVIAILDGNLIIGQSIIVQPTAQYPDTGMVDMTPVARPEKVSVLQGVLVSPAYRGKGLMQAMVAAWLKHAHSHGRTHALSEIEVRNVASWSAFLKEGLTLTSIGVDHRDLSFVYNAHAQISSLPPKTLTLAFNDATAGDQVICRKDNLEQQQTLFRQGYSCIAYYKPAECFILGKPENKVMKTDFFLYR